MEKVNECLLYLMACAMEECEVKEQVIDGVDLKQLLNIARKHSVASMVCTALEKTKVFEMAEENIRKGWIEAKVKAIRREMLLDAQREILLREMENAGIWYMPLKGIVLKEWYPRMGMREMADNDILIDSNKRKEVKEIFLRHNYEIQYYNEGNHDIYIKAPFYNFEMHVSLFHKGVGELYQKYANVKEKLIPVKGKKYQYSFTPEDFYIFVIAHAYKHYTDSGIGVRAISDIYIINKKIGDTINKEYVKKELLKLGINKYEEKSRKLAEKVFNLEYPCGKNLLTNEEEQMLQYYLGAGTFGTMDYFMDNHLHKIQGNPEEVKGFTKIKYCLKRLFPDMNFCRDSYPFVYRHQWIYPFFCVWRICCKAFVNRKKIGKELEHLRKK